MQSSLSCADWSSFRIDYCDKNSFTSEKCTAKFMPSEASLLKPCVLTPTTLSLKNNLTILCGRYEGIDQRVLDKFVDEELSLGDYVISGGETASMVLVEGISRLIPGVVEDIESIKRDSFQNGILDYPHFTKPEEIDDMKIPDVLISGNHEKIELWRKKHALGMTWLKRPDLLKNVKLSKEDDKLLKEYILEYKKHEQK